MHAALLLCHHLVLWREVWNLHLTLPTGLPVHKIHFTVKHIAYIRLSLHAVVVWTYAEGKRVMSVYEVSKAAAALLNRGLGSVMYIRGGPRPQGPHPHLNQTK